MSQNKYKISQEEPHQLYERLLNQIQEVAWIGDINKETLKINQFYTSPSCENVYEFTQNEIAEDIEPLFECITPRSNKLLRTEIEKSIKTCSNGRCFGNYLTPKTKRLTKQKWCWSTENINGCVRCYGTTTDVTKEFESIASKAAQEIAEIENKKKKTFLERTCHEQRNLHMGVSGGAEVAIDYVENLKQQISNLSKEITKISEILNIISDSSEHINHLLDTTLSLQQMESEHFSYTYDFHDIQKTIDSCSKQMVHMIRVSTANLNITIDKVFKNILIRYDNIKMIQAIMNYLSNAYKYTENGTIKLDITYKNKKEDTIEIEIIVSDTGIGIEIGNINSIFELYKQVDSTRGGSGIGLYLVKKYIEEGHNGTVHVTSEYRKGSSFYILFTAQYKKNSEIVIKIPAVHPSMTLDYKDILLVEDQKSNRVLIGAMLMNLGYSYDECVDGEEALEKYKDTKYGVILSDRKMSRLDGIELTKRILKINRSQIVIGITGNSIKEQVDEWLEIGAKFIITKPCSKAKLKEILSKYVIGICESGSGI